MSDDTADLIARARAAVEGVTDGPWMVQPNDDCAIEWSDGGEFYPLAISCTNASDADFIAGARTLVPALADALEAAEARVGYEQAENDRWSAAFDRVRARAEPGKVTVDPVVVSCAVRYALGRRTYMPGLIADVVRSTWMDLGDQREVVRESVERHLADQAMLLRPDAEMDNQTWVGLLNWMREQEADRLLADNEEET